MKPFSFYRIIKSLKIESFLHYNLKHKYFGVFLVLIPFLWGISQGLNLPVSLSLTDLLPERSKSVSDMEAVTDEVGGGGHGERHRRHPRLALHDGHLAEERGGAVCSHFRKGEEPSVPILG